VAKKTPLRLHPLAEQEALAAYRRSRQAVGQESGDATDDSSWDGFLSASFTCCGASASRSSRSHDLAVLWLAVLVQAVDPQRLDPPASPRLAAALGERGWRVARRVCREQVKRLVGA